MMKLGPLPEVYATVKPSHDDWLIKGIPRWLQPWSYIPRSWTGLGLPMPPVQLAGTAPNRKIEVQENYPIWSVPEPDEETNKWYVWGPDPVPPIGCWTLQGVRLGCLTIPCYFALSILLFGRRLHFNGFCKPDVTKGDWYWWFEMSITWTELKTHGN